MHTALESHSIYYSFFKTKGSCLDLSNMAKLCHTMKKAMVSVWLNSTRLNKGVYVKQCFPQRAFSAHFKSSTEVSVVAYAIF